MTATAFTCEAPADAQLAYIADLCAQRGLEPPAAIFSKTDASTCIEAIRRGQYDPAFFGPHSPTFYGLGADDSDVPF